MSDGFDEQDKRIAQILRSDDARNDLLVSKENIEKFIFYLKENIKYPCILTGTEDFPWEERYVFGYGDEDEYKTLKKTNPSYQDTYELLDFEAVTEEQAFIKVRRELDKKEFLIALDWLEAVDDNSRNYILLNDYAVWFINY